MNDFYKFEYHMFYVLYQFVAYLLTLPHIIIIIIIIICRLVNNADSGSDYIASNDWLLTEQ
jgi:hypothetical protein